MFTELPIATAPEAGTVVWGDMTAEGMTFPKALLECTSVWQSPHQLTAIVCPDGF